MLDDKFGFGIVIFFGVMVTLIMLVMLAPREVHSTESKLEKGVLLDLEKNNNQIYFSFQSQQGKVYDSQFFFDPTVKIDKSLDHPEVVYEVNYPVEVKKGWGGKVIGSYREGENESLTSDNKVIIKLSKKDYKQLE